MCKNFFLLVCPLLGLATIQSSDSSTPRTSPLLSPHTLADPEHSHKKFSKFDLFDAQDKDIRIEELTKIINNLEDGNEQLTREKLELKEFLNTAYQSNQDLEKENEHHKKIVITQESTISSYRTVVARLTKLYEDEKDDAESEHALLTKTRTEIMGLKCAVDTMRHSIENTGYEMKKMTQENKMLEEMAAHAETDLKDLIDEADATLDQAREDQGAFEELQTALRDKLDGLQTLRRAKNSRSSLRSIPEIE